MRLQEIKPEEIDKSVSDKNDTNYETASGTFTDGSPAVYGVAGTYVLYAGSFEGSNKDEIRIQNTGIDDPLDFYADGTPEEIKN